MKPLIWKEFRENFKWAALVVLLLGGITILQGPPTLLKFMKQEFLLPVSLFAAGCGAALGFLQVFFESRGDRRALLLHRPMSPSRIFLGKAVVGVGLYLLALGIPLAWSVAWAATPGHYAAPFRWRMALPWLADILTGVVYYFAGMLLAQREARWYGSRGLGLAAAFLCSFLVWALPEFGQALLAIGILGSLLAVAAWGSFLTGGAYAPQPRLAKAALATTFLLGLLSLSVGGKVAIGAWFDSDTRYRYTLDREGRVLVVRTEHGAITSVTDLEGRQPQALAGKPLETSALTEFEAPFSGSLWPSFRSYRNLGRLSVWYGNESRPGSELWYYVPDQGRLLGYDAPSKRLIGSIGPDGFIPPGQQPRQRFQGEPSHASFLYDAGPAAYLDLSGCVSTVNFARRTVRTLFTPAEGETLQGTLQWKDEKRKRTRAFVLTDRSVHLVEESGAPVFTAPLACDREEYGLVHVGRLEDPERFVVWYEPSWYLWADAGKSMPSYLVEYDAAGREIARRTLPPRPLPPPPYIQALFGLVSPLVETSVLVGGTQDAISGARSVGGREVRPLLLLLLFTAQYFIPGVGWEARADGGVVLAFATLSLLSAAACALGCFLLARRYAFSRARRIGWALCGLLFGWVGLLLMFALQEWPARVGCPGCRKRRVVSRDACEHCGAPHAAPAPDGTEIFETTTEGGGAIRNAVYQTATLDGEHRM
jgi:hypothetical protein